MKFNLKVFINRSNGQSAVHLPKKMFEKVPKEVEIRVPEKYMKKIIKTKFKWG